MQEPILTALDPESDELVRIVNAVKGNRYKGINEHENCLFYPRFPAYKRPSFAHLPGKSECPDFRGESPEHRAAKKEWVKYLEDQISGCPICTRDGRDAYPNHECPPMNARGEPFDNAWSHCRGILWFCQECNQPHLLDALGKAVMVKEEWWAPRRATRTDIALLDDDGEPICLIEIKKEHLSDNALKYATENGIPLFVLNVKHGLENAQPHLHRNGITSPTGWPDFSTLIPRNFDFARVMTPSTTFVARTDEKSILSFQILHDKDPNDTPHPIPQPSIGMRFILASVSTLTCKEYTDKKWSEWMIPIESDPAA